MEHRTLSSRVAPFILAAAFGPKFFAIGSKLFKSVTMVKAGLAGASVVAYSWLFSWEFALIIIFSLVIHEYGHVWAMRAVGIPTKGFYLIPFVGGAAVPERAFASRLEEHFVAIAGPVFGLAQAVFLYGLFVVYEHPFMGAVAAWIAVLNLFNMIPITPLDGGRIVKSATMSVAPGVGMTVLMLGIFAAIALMFWLRSWVLALVVLVSMFEFMVERRTHRFTPDPYLKRMTPGQTGWCLASYVAVVAALALITYGCLSIPEARLAMTILSDG
jgi:Zn-dependent protease